MAGRWPKRVLIIIAGILLLLVLLAGGGLLYLRSDSGRAWLVSLLRQEVRSSLAAELTVSQVQGDPIFGLELIGVSLKKDGRVFFQTRSLAVSLSLADALGKVPHVEKIILTAPRLILPLPDFPKQKAGSGGLSIGIIEAREISLSQPGRKGSPALSLKGGRLAMSGLRLGGVKTSAKGIAALADLKYQARLSVAGLTWGRLKMSRIQAQVKSGDGRLAIKPLSLRLLGSPGSGSAELDARQGSKVALRFLFPAVDTRQALAGTDMGKRLQGMVRVQLNLQSRGASPALLQKNLAGHLLITGSNLKLGGIDLDGALDRYQQGTSIGLFDVGSFFLLGPLGPLGLKTLQAGDAARRATSGSTPIRRLRADWSLAGGRMSAQDVAFSSARHRVAVKGIIDLRARRFKDFVVAVVDKKGCPLHVQKVSGPLDKPQIEKSQAVAGSLVRPLVSLFKGITKPIRPACKPFYQGRVPHPQ